MVWWGAMAFSIAVAVTWWIFVQIEAMDEQRRCRKLRRMCEEVKNEPTDAMHR